MGYSDKEHVDIAQMEYRSYNEGDPVKINNNKTIGYVAKVVNDKKTGEQAFIITDGNPKVQKPAEVNHVTVLFQGSLGLDKIGNNPGEVKRDWWDNNKQILGNIEKSYKNPDTLFKPTKQMKSSAKTLNDAMNTYKNATFDTYGHSQSSTNVQYALGALDSEDKVNRMGGAFVYQGPNAYSMMTEEQRKIVAKLKNRIFNFVDEKDIVPIGYRHPDWNIKLPYVGNLIFVDSVRKGMTDQHMWGGYNFKDGYLKVTKESLKEFQQAKHAYNRLMMGEQMKALKQLEKKLTASGGGLSSGERIYLDDSKALAVVSHASSEFEAAMLSVLTVYQKGIIQAEELWTETVSDAREIGIELSEGEILDALESVGCTKQRIVTEPTSEYKEKINKAKKMSVKFQQLAQEIRSKIEKLVQADKELSAQLKGLVS